MAPAIRWVATLLVVVALGAATAAAAAPGGTWHDKIKRIVVVMEENRSFDHFLGWRPGVNGYNASDYNKNMAGKKVYVNKDAHQIAHCDPDHSFFPTTVKVFGPKGALKENKTDATMSGFAWMEELLLNEGTRYCGVMNGMTREKLPVLNALADNYVLMDRIFASHPGPTWPNRMFFMAGSSGGSTETGPWYHNNMGSLFPMKTIFKQVEEAGGSWKVYYNDTPWELFMQDLAHSPDNLRVTTEFFDDARKGTLPTFSFINPRAGINVSLGLGSNDQHPDHDISLAESYYKDVYEAVRNSPQWNETLLVLTYDEHGGFYDHVPTPLNVPPPGDGEKSYPDEFRFDRLGIRIPTILISPWVKKGRVVSEAPADQKPQPNSEYDLTSIMASTRKLLKIMNGTPALTNRDAWAATFEHVVEELTEPRTDCPRHLPDPLPPIRGYEKVEAGLPLNSLQTHIATVHAHLAGVHYPGHVKQQGQVSEWLQHHFHLHKQRALSHQQLRRIPAKAYFEPGFTVHLVPQKFPGASISWLMEQDKTKAFVVLAQFQELNGTLKSLGVLCMDAGQSLKPFARVGVRRCDGGMTPSTNTNPSQQWLFTEAMLRPYTRPDLCVTNHVDGGSPRLHLQPCTGALDQHYSYQGAAPGDDWNGHIYYGDDINAVAIMKT